jgi:hypothetical protein
MGQEKLSIFKPLARRDGQRGKRNDQFIDLETAERVPARFGRIAVTTEERSIAR